MNDATRIDRRGALLVAASLATGPCAALFLSEEADGAKRIEHEKKRKGDSKKKGKNKKNKEGSGTTGGNTGKDIVRVAKKYKGSKYVWAGASPKGFDCSGFTWYVYDQVTGNDIGRTVKSQYNQGHSVSRGSWKPGDIVFFKNTFEKGLSHCGIYISGDKFIHAENENTGVVISSLGSGYYKDHYAGARRLV